jgi:EAL domain-containing protein (putative c-di-GMP-specific phosphodiesterase class I)
MGGDEFVAVLTDVDDKAGCERVLQRLLNAASAPMNLQDDGLAQAQLTASLGVALFPKDGVEPDILLRRADQAMYQAKQTGKNRAHFFDSGEDEAARQRNEHIDRVAQALIDREFVLYYQPKVNMRSGEVVGAEALIRWQHPEQGLLGPGQFLPGIEGHAVSVSVGQWVMETAMSQMAAWKAQGLHLPVSVNISAHHLQQDDFALQLEALLARYPHVPPHCLKLEVLETSALDDMTWVAEVMQACSKLGVAFSLDDFGTGYSSLTYLKRLPAHELKIDQSFVRDMLQNPEDLAIVEGVIGLSNAFGRSVIAEGVETEDHGVLLLRLGCELAQGYGVARPMAAEHIGAWIQSWQPPPAWRALAAHTPHRADQPLIFAEVEHRHWVRQIELSMVNGLPAPPMNVHECRFGKALDRLLKDPRFNRRAEAGHLVELHEATHLAAARLMAHVQRGEHAQTAEALAQLHAATDALVLQLRTMCEV